MGFRQLGKVKSQKKFEKTLNIVNHGKVRQLNGLFLSNFWELYVVWDCII